MDPFERRVSRLIVAHSDVATDRQIDALGIARTALASRDAGGWWRTRGAGARQPRHRIGAWAAAISAVTIVGITALVIQQLPEGPAATLAISPSPDGSASRNVPIPEGLLHAWERPYMVSPGQQQWPSANLRVTDGFLDVRSDIFEATGRSMIVAVSPDTFAATANAETIGCRDGDVGTYRWALDGEGTILRLKAIPADACSARQEALDGDWVRADLPPNPANAPDLSAGRHETSLFDPFDDADRPGQLAFTVPKGWRLEIDEGQSIVLHRAAEPIQGRPADDTLITVLAQPRVAAELEDGAECVGFTVAPGVGTTVDDMVAAITTRPGIDSATPTALKIGRHEGVLLDLEVSPSWTGGCQALEGFIQGVPVVTTSSTGPGVGIGPDLPSRLILLDLGSGRTAAIAIAGLGGDGASRYEEAVAEAMPIVESFEFNPASP
jgi:hypothetical protein